MDTTNKKLAETFSGGAFAAVYDHFADDIRWEVAGEKIVEGKNNVIAFCKEMTVVMGDSVLINTNIIEDGSRIAVEGKCDFIDEKNEQAQVRYCDCYLFDQGKIKTITSYCITVKKTN